MDLNQIKQQAEISKKAIAEIQKQNRIFDTLLQKAMTGAPEEDKKTIASVQSLSMKALNLAKQGKMNEAQNLIKSFSYGD